MIYNSTSHLALKLAIYFVELLKNSPRGITWTWDTIKGFGAAKALKTSYVFLFVVPVLARVLVNMPETITLPIWGKTITVALSLPFSWVLLFVSACLASIGNLIYSLMCPHIIKEFADFPAFRATERDGTYLRLPIRQLALVSESTTLVGQVTSVHDNYNSVPVDVRRLEQTLGGGAEMLPCEFYFVRDAANLGRPLARLIASMAYFGAFTCLAIIAGQNAWYVAEYWHGMGAAR